MPLPTALEERLAGVVYDKDMKVSRRAGPVSSVGARGGEGELRGPWQ